MEAAAQIVPEGDAVLAQGLDNRGERIAASKAFVATRAAADFALFDPCPDVAFRAVGVQGRVRAVEYAEQLLPDCQKAVEHLVERGKPCERGEDALEPSPQAPFCHRIDHLRLGIGLEGAIQLPDPGADFLDQLVLLRGRAGQPVDQSLGMNPASGVVADIELRRAVADDDGAVEQSLFGDRCPKRSLAGGAAVVLAGHAEVGEVLIPGGIVGKALSRRHHQRTHRDFRQIVFAPVFDGGLVHAVARRPGDEDDLEEVDAALAVGGFEEGKVLVANLGRDAVAFLVASRGVVGGQRRADFKARDQNLPLVVMEFALVLGQQGVELREGNLYAVSVQLIEQLRLRDVALVGLRQDEADQVRPVMAGEAIGQRRDHQLPVRCLPHFAMVAGHMGLEHKVLNNKRFAAFELRTGRNVGRLQYFVRVDGQVGGTHAALPAAVLPPLRTLARPGRSGLAVVVRPVFHPARLDIRPGLQALGPRQIVEKRIDQAILLKGKDLQVIKRYSIKIWEGKQLRHARY